MLAEITKHSEGALEGNSVFAVLNANTLELVAELPKIVANQFGYVGYVTEDKMLVQTTVPYELWGEPKNALVNYVVDVNTGDLELYLHDMTQVEEIEGGFILDGVVYDYEWNEYFDFNQSYSNVNSDYQMINGQLLVYRGWDSINDGWKWAKIAKVPLEYDGNDPEYIGNTFGTGEYATDGYGGEYRMALCLTDCIKSYGLGTNVELTLEPNGKLFRLDYYATGVGDVTALYNLDGTLLLQDEKVGVVKTITDEATGYSIRYNVTYEIAGMTQIGTDVAVEYVEEWELIPDSTYNSWEEQPAASYSYSQWYILK